MLRNHRPLIALLCLPLFLTACDKAPEQAAEGPPLRLVHTITMAPPAGKNWRELPGRVEAARSSQLGFRIPGKLKELSVREGVDVEADQVLARLDDADQQIQISSRRAEYRQQQADFKRGSELVKQGLISRSDFQKLQAQEASAKAALASASQALKNTVLKAPFAGRVAKRYVENFEEVTSSQPIYLLNDLSSLTINVDVPESLMIRVRQGSRPRVFAVFDTIPGQSFPLTLREVATQADPETSTFQVRFNMPPLEDFNVLPGMSVTVRGERDDKTIWDDTILYVPAQAVLEDADGQHVWVAEPDAGALGRISRRAVKTGPLSSLGFEVKEGLEQGDRVVVAGMSRMVDGLQVRLGAE